MLPQVWFKEQLVRVFLRPSGDDDIDRRSSELLAEAFGRWCVKNTMKEPKVRQTGMLKVRLKPIYVTSCWNWSKGGGITGCWLTGCHCVDQLRDLTSQIRLGWLESIVCVCVCQVKPGHSLSKDLSSNCTGNHSAESVDAMCNDAKSPVVQTERSCCGCSTEIKKSVWGWKTNACMPSSLYY